MNNKFKVLVSIMAIVLSAQIFTIPATAGKPQKPVRLQEGDVKILASGTSTTENEAVAIALRSALEQAFGTFVSANTTLVNDALVKDEIVSITTGNIKHYDIINSTLLPNGNTTVLLNAIVSTNNLVKYAQNHGSSTELAGNKLAMAMRLEQMNIESERKTMQNLMEQLKAFLPNLFDYEIEAGEPNMSTLMCSIPISIKIKSNKNTLSFQNILKNTLSALPAPSYNVKDNRIEKFKYLQIVKELHNGSDWYNSFKAIFERGILPQLTSFRIVDQNGNLLKQVMDFSPRNYSDITKSIGHGVHYNNNDIIISGKPISIMVGRDESNLFPAIYRYEFVSNSAFVERIAPYYIIFPFPEIIETTSHNHSGKKSRKTKEEDYPSEELFIIKGLSLSFDIEEINRISEIKVEPITKEHIYQPSVDEKDLNWIIHEFLQEKGIDLEKRTHEKNFYGLHIDTHGKIAGTGHRLIYEFSPMMRDLQPIDFILYFEYHYYGCKIKGYSPFEEKNEKVIMLN